MREKKKKKKRKERNRNMGEYHIWGFPSSKKKKEKKDDDHVPVSACSFLRLIYLARDKGKQNNTRIIHLVSRCTSFLGFSSCLLTIPIKHPG
jgi:hypothetical protein